ncbi:MAG: ligase-associated DNA damage response endonuclease PdeM [Pseudomonadota bacterium]
MNSHAFEIAGNCLEALPSGALWWPEQRLLAVADLHLGKAERLARQGGSLLPPYETAETLERLEGVLGACAPRTVVLVGDSFDDLGAADALPDDIAERIARMAAGRRWIWIAGNHDPGPVDLPGTHLAEHRVEGLSFRHIAEPGGGPDVSGHYHPKARLWLRGQSIRRPCFLIDSRRVILPAFGTYTGGLRIDDPAFDRIVTRDAIAVLTGKRAIALPRSAAMA